MLWPSTAAGRISYKLNPSYGLAAEINLLSSAARVMQEVRGDSHNVAYSPKESVCKAIKTKIIETEFCFPLVSDRRFSSAHSIVFLMELSHVIYFILV